MFGVHAQVSHIYIYMYICRYVLAICIYTYLSMQYKVYPPGSPAGEFEALQASRASRRPWKLTGPPGASAGLRGLFGIRFCGFWRPARRPWRPERPPQASWAFLEFIFVGPGGPHGLCGPPRASWASWASMDFFFVYSGSPHDLWGPSRGSLAWSFSF